jgi:hypothetical protein
VGSPALRPAERATRRTLARAAQASISVPVPAAAPFAALELAA